MTSKIIDAIGAPFFIALAVLILIGDFYWLFQALQWGSFIMFIIGMAGPSIIISGPVGAYALIFGWPSWIAGMFG